MDKQIISNVIDLMAERYASRTAIESPQGTIDYAGLKDVSDHIGSCLVSLGVAKGSVIGVCLPSSVNYIAGILGVNKAGGIFMPLEIDYPAARLRYLLQLATPACIITDPETEPKLVHLLGEETEHTFITVCNSEGGLRLMLKGAELPASPGTVLPVVDGNDSNYLIYTSGSTGTPKIIEGRHKSLSHFIHWEINEFGLDESVRSCQFAPLSFDVSFRDIFVPLLAGGCVVVPGQEEKKQPLRFIEWLGSKKISLLHMVPSFFREITRVVTPSNRHMLQSLRNILLAGEPLFGKDVFNWVEKAGPAAQLTNLYGPSETTLAKLFNRIRETPRNLHEIVPLGHPIGNTTAAIIHDGRLCTIGEIGEIHIKTPFISKGYFNDAELTQSKFIQNPLHNKFEDILYKTGDLGKYLPDKSIAFTGRTDSQVKIRGNRVELVEVVQTIQRYPGIKHAEVIAAGQHEEDIRLCCYYTENFAVDIDRLTAYLGQYLPAYMHPAYFVLLPQFPLNLNGKVDKRALPRPEEMLYEQLSYEAPATDLEEKLAGIWKEILGLKKAGVNNSFFQLGGHSLTATRIISALFQQLNKTISLKDFFENNTIRTLGRFLENSSSSGYVPIAPVTGNQPHEASFAQKRLFMIDRQSGGSGVYNMPVAINISGDISVEAIQKAFTVLVERHEVLRTTFTDRNGVIYQQIHPPAGIEVEAYDRAGDAYSVAAARLVAEEGTRITFDLEKGPLVRVKLYRFADRQFLLLLVIHHIVCDGWSMGVITREILHLYKAFAAGGTLVLPGLKIQYKDYSDWLIKRVQQDKEGYAFWHRQLGQDAVFGLPLDYPRQAGRAYQGNTVFMQVEEALSGRIRKFCIEHDISPFIFFQGILNLLLYKTSGQPDVLVGTPVAGRNYPGLESQIGLYLNYLVLKNHVDGDGSFSSFLQAVKKNTYECFRHQDYPFDKLVEELLPNNTGDGRNPLYDVLFVMNNAELNASASDIAELEQLLNFRWVPVHEATSKVDLTFLINDEKEFVVNTEYRTDLFRETTIRQLNKDLILLMEEALGNEDATPDDIIWNISGDQELTLLEKNKRLINEDF